MPRSGSPDLTPAAFSILLALADRERHGYEIMQAIAQDSDGAVRLGPTTLYRSIRTLLQAGLIAEADQRPDPALDDERRRYYRLTATGSVAMENETGRLRRLLAMAEGKAMRGRTERQEARE